MTVLGNISRAQGLVLLAAFNRPLNQAEDACFTGHARERQRRDPAAIVAETHGAHVLQ